MVVKIVLIRLYCINSKKTELLPSILRNLMWKNDKGFMVAFLGSLSAVFHEILEFFLRTLVKRNRRKKALSQYRKI